MGSKKDGKTEGDKRDEPKLGRGSAHERSPLPVTPKTSKTQTQPDKRGSAAPEKVKADMQIILEKLGK